MRHSCIGKVYFVRGTKQDFGEHLRPSRLRGKRILSCSFSFGNLPFSGAPPWPWLRPEPTLTGGQTLRQKVAWDQGTLGLAHRGGAAGGIWAQPKEGPLVHVHWGWGPDSPSSPGPAAAAQDRPPGGQGSLLLLLLLLRLLPLMVPPGFSSKAASEFGGWERGWEVMGG